jgi:hypothetical protein
VATAAALAFLAGLAQVAAAADAGRKKQLDLTYVPGDSFGAMVLHPQELVKAPPAAPILKAMSLPVALDPASIDEVLILFPVPDRGAPSFVVRLSQAANTDLMAKEFLGLMGRRGGTVVEATVAGKRCYKFEAPAEEPPKEGQPAVPPRFRDVSPAMTCGADDRTVLVATSGEDQLKKMLSGGEAKGPLVERLRQADVNHDVVMVFALEPMRGQLKENLERERKRPTPSPNLPILEILTVIQTATIAADLNDDTLGKIVLQAADAAGTAKVEEQAKVFQQRLKDEIETGRKRIAEMPAEMPQEFRAQIEKTMALGEKVVNALTVTKSGADVVVTLKPIKGIGPDILEMMGARMGPRRPVGPPPPKPAAPE